MQHSIKAIVTDIEGTTTKISFVHEVLFPYAAKHLASFVTAQQHHPEVINILTQTREIAKQPHANLAETIAILLDWIKQDQKITPLKTLQGLIWQTGYEQGELHSHIYPDAYECLKQWHQQGYQLYVYSSGSIQAQKLLFAHTTEGDITPWFLDYFDTTIGNKKQTISYQAICKAIGCKPEQVLFLSDSLEELDAAQQAQLNTVGLAREGIKLETTQHQVVNSFHSIALG